ncbi:MAG TPA: SGNH/GDSL hydrolase family protein [Isosphaeraceae bacterium]|nr:SGNH/GDSL hydrolase family protein [Isosphaeraceae bacterium]
MISWRRKIARSFRSRRPEKRQRVFAFVSRAERLERTFKLTIAITTMFLLASFLTFLSPGRYLTSWLKARAWQLTTQAMGLPLDRGEIDADWQRKRLFDIEQSRGTLEGTFAEYPPAMQRLLRYAGLDPEHALVRWGNFDRTVLLPSTVFEAEQSGRSYQFRPNVRSIWIRNFPVKGPVKAYFQVPESPEIIDLVKGTGAEIVSGSTQTTNSWALRGPEPDLKAPWRGIVLGDSYMQGLFIGDDQTPTECLKRELTTRLGATVEVLNTGHLGYSPEQYYYTLVEYGKRFAPHFVVVSFFANDFGDFQEALEGKGDWEEAQYWMSRISQYCFSHPAECVMVPAPWVNQIEGPQRAGNYPGKLANILDVAGPGYLDPMPAFANAQLEISNKARRLNISSEASPLFNGRIGDGHFSARGSEVWASAVGRRVALLLQRRRLAEEHVPRHTPTNDKRQVDISPNDRAEFTRRSP